MGMNAEKFRRILRHLELREMLLVIPTGIYPYEIRKADSIEIGYSWYQYRGDQDEFRKHLLQAEAHLLQVLDEVEKRHRIDRSRSVVLGFSQGGYLAGFCALRHPERFAGLICAGARLKYEFLVDEISRGSQLKSLLIHSQKDKSIAWETAEASFDQLRENGAQIDSFLHSEGHRLPPESVVHIGRWLGDQGFDTGQVVLKEIREGWQALEADRPEEALKIVAHLIDQSESEALLLAACAHMDLEEWSEARKRLESMPDDLDGDTEYLRRFYLAQVLYQIGEPQLALNYLLALEGETTTDKANLRWWAGLCYDFLGQERRADGLFEEARRLDPEGAPRPQTASIELVESEIETLLKELPPELRSVVEREVPIHVLALPPLSAVRSSRGKLPPDTLGLYTGTHRLERSVLEASFEPAAIYLFIRNLERFSRSPEDLRDQIRTTLLHELGHHLGFDEEGIEDLGLS